MKIYERVHFRLINAPCCGTILCCVNPRYYNYCPECGKHIIKEIPGAVLISDNNATLTFDDEKKP